MNALLYFWLLLRASLLSTGGSGNLPLLYDDLIERGWASERQFAESLAIGQISPGPTGLWVISLGYLTNGLRGAVLALLAITLPPLLVLLVERLHRRVEEHPAMQGLVRGLSLAIVGITLMVVVDLLRNTGLGLDSLAIALLTLVLGLTGRVPVVVLLLLAGALGVALT